MAETVKKASAKPKAPAKPRKTAAAKEAAVENGVRAASNGAPTNVTQMKLPHDQVAQLAHRYWAERGHQHGHHEEDWYRAEQELRGKAS
jgi:hypothetical protein